MFFKIFWGVFSPRLPSPTPCDRPHLAAKQLAGGRRRRRCALVRTQPQPPPPPQFGRITGSCIIIHNNHPLPIAAAAEQGRTVASRLRGCASQLGQQRGLADCGKWSKAGAISLCACQQGPASTCCDSRGASGNSVRAASRAAAASGVAAGQQQRRQQRRKYPSHPTLIKHGAGHCTQRQRVCAPEGKPMSATRPSPYF